MRYAQVWDYDQPVAKPNTNSETPNMPTSVLTPNSAAMAPVAAEKMLEANAEVMVV
jgi:hypothetical protein